MSLSPRPPAPRARRAPDLSRELTSERIADHLAEFRREGGRIERIGTTRVLTRIDETTTDVPRPVAVPTRTRA
ncbi:hypothetical protein [Cognatilysobacter bugurensis]|uniref:Uncharacterized protein n=1 Tax=Cognatilysobacter bugurensis TaxID=543356 RepID=A0A918WA07_9GAMM|nr:hypothetical protein [Lysobacter bugurensis]GHA83303.1 hypothetical protein GCM10007067_21770 [Lysobacter bugurensis]